MPAPQILFVLTSESQLGNTGKPTGWYLPEFAHPYNILAPHSQVTVASPAGGEAPLDQNSVEAFKSDQQSVDFLNQKSSLWKNTRKLSTFVGRAKEFSAIFFVGGHGPMFDLVKDQTSIQIIREFNDAGKVVSAVCHGPAALLNVKLADGSYLIHNEPVTGFTNAEEDQGGMTSSMPFLLEDELGKNSGGKFEKAEPWHPKVVVAKGGRLITGQNPQSATGVGQAILAQLGTA